jgi:tryptophan synthase alpha chain
MMRGSLKPNSMTRIETKFAELKAEGRKAFIPYITTGDPSMETTLELVLALEKAGADLIELGVPFSDPIADGPVIQRATERALHNGVTLQKVLDLGKSIRRKSEIPLILFSYYNPLLNHGLEKLAKDAAASGFDGVLASDLTLEESGVFDRTMRAAGLNTIYLVAPTSSAERMRAIAEASNGRLPPDAAFIHEITDRCRFRHIPARTPAGRMAGSGWSNCR